MKIKILSLIIVILLIGTALAEFSYQGNNIKKSYNEGEKITGNFNITLTNHPNEILSSNLNGNITLINFLNMNNLNAGEDYNCSTPRCASRLASQNSISSIPLNNEKTIGIRIQGPSPRITSAKIKLLSNAQSTCTNPLSIDILNNEENIIVVDDYSTEVCQGEYKGCFDSSVSTEVEIVNTNNKKFCEKIKLPPAPAYQIGARIRNSPSGNAELKMTLYDFETGNKLKECILPTSTQQIENLGCVVEYSSNIEKDYYVCVSTASNVGYKIPWETSQPTCGTAEGFSSLNSDFDIFGKKMKYSSSPEIEINNTNYLEKFGEQLSSSLNSYLSENYNSNCQENECIIPIKLQGINQNINLEEVEIKYETVGVTQTVTALHEISVEEPLITSKKLILNLEKADFTIPFNTRENAFKLYSGEDIVFTELLNITKTFDFSVFPRFVPFGQLTLFKINTTENIISSTWNFGDDTELKQVQGKEISHRYIKNQTSFILNLTLTNGRGQTSRRNFQILVGSPKELVNLTINDYKKRITNITSTINSKEAWIKSSLEEIINLSKLTTELNSLESRYASSSTESQYKAIILDLIELKIPIKIVEISHGDLIPLAITHENINVNYIEQISNKDIQNNNKLKNSIIGLMNSNFDATISSRILTGIYDAETESLVSYFKIQTSPKKQTEYKNFLILANDIQSIGKFKTDYNSKKISGSNIDYIELSGNSDETFEFIIESGVSPKETGIYISPNIENINIIDSVGVCNLDGICSTGETEATCPEDCSKKGFKFTLIGWTILFFIALIIYIILQEWYKRKYEKHLFKDENDLYNLINFIYNARKEGFPDSEIEKNLKNTGWSNEKISFGMRKISGKRTGMFEIPIFKFFENRKVKRELEKRQQKNIDTKFIKRRNLNMQ